MKKSWLILSIILILSLLMSSVTAQAPQDVKYNLLLGEDDWYIVELEQPSLAAYARTGSGLSAMTTIDGKLDVQAAASRTYVEQLVSDQAVFAADLTTTIPGAVVGYNYQIALNAVAVQLPGNTLQMLKALRDLSGVKKITPQRFYDEDMDYSLDLINAAAAWSQLGGRDTAGAGIKVAVIDSGIDPDHPLFDGTGWSYPTTGDWPKGNAAFCNGKIIAARYYMPTFEVNVEEELTPQDHRGHGTHVGGTAAGNRTTATFGTATTEVSGVAPGAWLMAYKALFLDVSGTRSTGSNIMLAAAIEDAIRDGADVINNSWGGDAWELDDPLRTAYEAAVDAGIVVVFAVGNTGPDYNTAGNPYSPKFINVGASTTKRAFYNNVQVTAPTPVTDTLQNFAATEMSDIAPSAIPTTTIGPLPYLPTGLDGNLRTTTPETLPGGLVVPTVTVGITQTAPYVNGWIAVIPRGTYNFSDKVANAKVHGAVAAIIYLPPNHPTYADDDWKGGFTVAGADLYTVITGKLWGGDLVNWWKTNGDLARVQIGYPVSPFETEVEDVIADFSSRGPYLDLSIAPDLVAPGVNILSGVQDGTYDSWGGTSMAAPHVTGAAALLKAMRPDWTPAQIKSALMSTASQTVLHLDKTTTADVMTQGAGRIDLSKAYNPGLTFDQPSHSFGMVAAGSTQHTVITAQNVSAAAETYSLSIAETVTDTGHVTVTVQPASVNVAAGGMAVFTVTIEADAGAAIQDVEGNVVLNSTTHTAHIPYWARIYEDTGNRVLLIDDDMDALFGVADYLSYYQAALAALGTTYDVWDAAYWFGLPTRDVLDQYDVVVYFSGDGPTSFYLGAHYGIWWGTVDDLRAYLAGGGKLIAFGQDAAWAMNYAAVPGVLFAGAEYSQDDVFGGLAIPQPSAVGVAPFLDGVLIDFDPTVGDGAGNMSTVDSLAVPNYSDISNVPFFAVPNTFTDTQGAGYLGAGLSSDPTLERVADPIDSGWFHLGYRTTFCSFGLEAVNNNTGYYTSTALLADMFDYVNDELKVTFDAPSYAVDKAFTPVSFSATMTSSVGADAVFYRWDFGDGSGYAGTVVDTVAHQYMVPGVYMARVEVTDEYGHTMVSEAVPVYVGHVVYLPLVIK
ncbi:MAG: S8 family serine peptidase [Anaerolineae bacterium]|nr:S8 family serine peptidase [Anaerolineae bacterium]